MPIGDGLFGQDKFVLTGDAQAVVVAGVFDDDFLLTVEQCLALVATAACSACWWLARGCVLPVLVHDKCLKFCWIRIRVSRVWGENPVAVWKLDDNSSHLCVNTNENDFYLHG